MSERQLQQAHTYSLFYSLRRSVAQHQSWLLFIVAGAGTLGIAAWLSFVIHFTPGDALSRTYSATMILHSRIPHLAAIGFIWPPLPTIAQVPLLLDLRFAYYSFSGGVVTALAASSLLVVLNRTLRWVEIQAVWRIGLLLAFALNPMWLFYAGNGMSEMPFLFFYTAATAAYLFWLNTGHWRQLVFASIATVLMFGCRYDALIYAGAFVVAMIGVLTTSDQEIQPPKIEANLFTFLTPVVYTVGLWMYFNFTLMGDAFYFLRSNYSNAYLTRNMAVSSEVAQVQQSFSAVVSYFLEHAGALSPLFIAVLFVAIVVAARRHSAGLAGLVLLTIAVPLFQLLMFYRGQTFGFLRFYMTVQPAALLIVAFLFRILEGKSRVLLLWVAVLGLVLGGVTSAQAMRNSHDETFIVALQQPDTPIDNYHDARTVATRLRNRFAGHNLLILADSRAEEVVLFSGMPERFILPSDPDYSERLAAPAQRADYVLISRPDPTDLEFHAISARYPKLYEYGGTNLTLDSEIGEFRLYRSKVRGGP